MSTKILVISDVGVGMSAIDMAARDINVPALHITQQRNGAEPTEICPKCAGRGWRLVRAYMPQTKACSKCGGTGKLRHC